MRRSHRRQRGFTLIEVVVGIALIGTLGLAIVAATDIGIRAMGRGGAGARAAGAHDISAFEQQVSADVARSQCLSVNGAAYGTCALSVKQAGMAGICGGTGFLCGAWSQLTGSVPGCHVAVYTQPTAGGAVVRQEYLMNDGTPVLQGGTHRVTTVAAGVTVSLSATPFTATSGMVWIRAIQLTVTDIGVARGRPTATIVARPLTADPGANVEQWTRC